MDEVYETYSFLFSLTFQRREDNCILGQLIELLGDSIGKISM